MTVRADRRITVLLVDDHRLVRDGVREILSAEDDLVVGADAASSAEAVARAVEHRPDVILLDVQIPGSPAADTVTRIRELCPGTRIIVLSMHDGAPLLRLLIEAGIRGYLHKSVDRRELVAAIRSVYLAPDRMVLSVSGQTMSQLHGRNHAVLSSQELDILKLVADALSNSQIATRLHISEATVKRHLHAVFVKLGAVSRIDAVNKAIAESLIAPRRAGAALHPGRGRG